MKKRNTYVLLFLISVVGLAIVQYQYLRIGLNLAKVQFNANIERVTKVVKEGLKPENKLTYLVGKALEKDTTFFTVEIDSLRDASRYFLNDYVGSQLVNNGLDSDFSYNLYSKDSLYFLSSPIEFDKSDKVESYPIELEGYFPELLGKPVVLELRFKNLYGYFLSKLNGLTLPSILFLLGICATIIWVLRTYYWQSNIITTTNEFINNLTHELKTPVFSIGLATKILIKTSSEKQKPVLDIIGQQVKRLTSHIDKVLELGSLESGKNVIHLEKVDFKPYLISICKEFQTLISIENGNFSFELEGKAYHIKVAIFHLENAIKNILDNAKKYSDSPLIYLKAIESRGSLHILITDNGKGISKGDKQKIFQKYYRVIDGDLHKVKGYGLGLSYVKKVIEKHKGKIQIESEEHKGTKITLTIPICKL